MVQFLYLGCIYSPFSSQTQIVALQSFDSSLPLSPPWRHCAKGLCWSEPDADSAISRGGRRSSGRVTFVVMRVFSVQMPDAGDPPQSQKVLLSVRGPESFQGKDIAD